MKPKKAAQKKSSLPLIIIMAVLAAAVVAGAMLVSSNRPGGGAPQQSLNQPRADARPNVFPGADPPRSKGPETAPVTLEEFGDYQCPSCGTFNPIVERLKNQYGDNLRVVFRHLPLQTIHKNAALAARAAEAAGLQGNFWKMHDMLYEYQKGWSDLPDPRPAFVEYAQRIGLDVERFKVDLEGGAVAARISADVRRADTLRITGTPTVFVNGMPMLSLKEEDLRREIDAAASARAK